MDLPFDGVVHLVRDRLGRLDADALIHVHLADCDYTLHGYWHGEEYVDTVVIDRTVRARLVDVAVGIDASSGHGGRVRVRCALEAVGAPQAGPTFPETPDVRVADVALIFDTDSDLVDEQWAVNPDSPLVTMDRRTS